MNPFSEEDAKRQQIEYKIHCAIIEQLPAAFPQVSFWHTPNRPGDATDGFFKKQMGAIAGISDIGLSWNFGKLECGWYEVKTPGEKPNPSQNKWLSKMANLGWHTGWGTSVKQAFETFESWGIPRAHRTVIEPDTRTQQRKFHDSFNFYKP